MGKLFMNKLNLSELCREREHIKRKFAMRVNRGRWVAFRESIWNR